MRVKNVSDNCKTLLRALVTYVCLFTASAFLFPAPVAAEDQVDAMLEMDFQDLVHVKITSVSKSKQALVDAAAAIFVLTSEDIRRSSANTIPDLLRTVPGLHVAQSESSSWAISARGFQDRFANKMLVMVDGRSVYSIGFGGTYWEHLDLHLKDIDRIEVIRGPGGSIWGANAVNGVINIITKNSAGTQGWSLLTGAGNEEKGFGTVRYGGMLSDNTSYRLYAKAAKFNEEAELGDTQGQDNWYRNQVGFRLDADLDGGDIFTLQGDGYHLNADTVVLTPDYTLAGSGLQNGSVPLLFDRKAEGGNLLGRYTLNPGDKSEWVFQGYVDFYDSKSEFAADQSLQYDLDIQHNYQWHPSVKTSVGVNTRVYEHELKPRQVMVDPQEETFLFVDGFLNSEWKLSDDIDVIVGTKVGHNDYTDTEVQPSARALCRVADNQRIWLAASRAVRIPDRVNNGVTYVNDFDPLNPEIGAPAIYTFVGNRDLDAEVLWAYEAGYRIEPTDSVYIDLALFYNDYEDVIGIAAGTPASVVDPVPAFNIPAEQFNSGEYTLYGGEIVVNTEPLDGLRLIATYSYLLADVDNADDTLLVIGGTDENAFVENMANLRTLWSVSESLELDTTLRYVDSVSDSFSTLDVDSYVAVDFRLGWHLSDTVEISFVGQNVFDSEHSEHATSNVNPIVGIERSFFWRLDIEM